MFATLVSLSRHFRLTMYTATDCQLCDVMKHEIVKASQTLPIQLSTYNIRDDSLADVHTWRRRYQYDIPVLHLNDRGELRNSFYLMVIRLTDVPRSDRNLSTSVDSRNADSEVAAGKPRSCRINQ